MPAAPASQNATTEAGSGESPSPAKFRYATKTALSLTLAYLIPMSMGWPQPQTAATTVMLIAATGMVSDSLQKGVLRVLGTLAGAIMGLALIAIYPQDRMVYLLAASVVVSIIIYLYNAYQGDSTVFMLTAVVTLMVFNGGDADGAFLYGVDRAFMTAFGVMVYTVIASVLWPVKTADNTRALAAGVANGYQRAFERLIHPLSPQKGGLDEQLSALLADEESFQTQFASAKNGDDTVAAYLPEWNTVVSCYEELESLLIPALKQETHTEVEFGLYLANYDQLVQQIQGMFGQVECAWQGHSTDRDIPPLAIQYNYGSLDEETHLTAAAVATRAELLQRIQLVLADLIVALDSLLFDRGGFSASRKPRGKPAFIWLDMENFKTALRAFSSFWIASAIWIHFNPPGGFMFVTMCTILIPLVSYTPVTPKLLFILFTVGFIFALPAYVFLLPQMTHWLELAVFLFSYAFIGFYVFQGPVSIFFLLGLFTLGIQNTMSYNFDAILLIILMFYLVCTMLIISVHFPFTSKAERIYSSLRRRFFQHCGRSLRHTAAAPGLAKLISGLRLGSGAALLSKLHSWGAKIDEKYFTANGQQQIKNLNRACELLLGQLQVLAVRQPEFMENPLITLTWASTRHNPLAQMCDALAAGAQDQFLQELGTDRTGVEARLDELLGDDYLQRYDQRQLAQFYVYLSLQASILSSIQACSDAQAALDWQQLGETKF
ncbi:MAG: FUSC family protein [Halioglobus sp.]